MNALRFLKDRIAIGRKARVQPMAPKQARQRVKEHLDRMEGMLDKDFLFGDSRPALRISPPTTALVVCAGPCRKPVIRSYPRVNAWMDRIRAFGHGAQSALSADEALEAARSSEPRAISEQGSDPMLGKTVSIAPDDYAREPVTGFWRQPVSMDGSCAVIPTIWACSTFTCRNRGSDSGRRDRTLRRMAQAPQDRAPEPGSGNSIFVIDVGAICPERPNYRLQPLRSCPASWSQNHSHHACRSRSCSAGSPQARFTIRPR